MTGLVFKRFAEKLGEARWRYRSAAPGSEERWLAATDASSLQQAARLLNVGSAEDLDRAADEYVAEHKATPGATIACPKCGGKELRLDAWVSTHCTLQESPEGDPLWGDPEVEWDNEFAYNLYCRDCDYDLTEEEATPILRKLDTRMTRVGWPSFHNDSFPDLTE